MRKEDKGTVIGQLTETLKEYPNFYLTDIEALDAEKTSKLRRECFKREVKLVVVKNNLLKKALENIEGDFSDLNVALKGNTAVMFSQVANAPARLIKDFTKDAKKGVVVKPALKAAYVQESFYVGAENCGLPTLPGLVLIRITPLAPRTPYTAVAEASFSTVNDSISSGSILLKLRSTPSTNTSGLEF